MNTANKLTISRILLTFLFMFFLFLEGFTFKVLALLVFIVACWTDYLDGYIAKKYNQTSDFGKLMDPIADKVLVIAAFLAFVEMKLIPAWIVLIIVFREFLITGLRILGLRKGKVIEAGMIGKHKTVSQMASIYVILFYIILKEAGTRIFSFWNAGMEYRGKGIIFYLMLFTALLTLVSGLSYLVKNRGIFLNAKNS